MRKNFAEAEKSCTFAVQKPERSVAPEAKSETQTKLERCRSGRSGRSRKPLYPYGYPGFESLSFRKKQPLGLLFFVESRDENPGRVRDRLRRFRSSAEKVIALALGSTKNPCLSANNPSNTAVGQILTAVIILYTYKNTYKFRGNPRPIQKHQYHKKSRRIRQKT